MLISSTISTLPSDYFALGFPLQRLSMHPGSWVGPFVSRMPLCLVNRGRTSAVPQYSDWLEQTCRHTFWNVRRAGLDHFRFGSELCFYGCTPKTVVQDRADAKPGPSGQSQQRIAIRTTTKRPFWAGRLTKFDLHKHVNALTKAISLYANPIVPGSRVAADDH